MPVVGRAAAMAATVQKKRRKRRSSVMSSNSYVDENGVRQPGEPRPIKRTRTKRYLFENIGWRGNEHHDRIAKKAAHLRDAKWFQTSIIGVIFLAGILVGIQTYPLSDDTLISTLEVLDSIVLVIFIVEIVVKLVAEGNQPLDFFRDAWNVFDFLIVVVGLMPFGGGAVTALRLVRLLRVLKLVRALPKLRILVMGLLKSLSSIAYIGLLLGLLFYLYAVLGVSVFGKNDPIHMGTLHIAFLTLFRCATLEDWTDVMYIAMQGCENYGYDGNEDLCTDSSASPLMAVVFHCSFIILSSMMILNLFIGVITSSMQDAKTELSADLEEDEEKDEDEIMMKRLQELYDIMNEASEEITELASLEKERSQSAVVQLSRSKLLNNKEMATDSPHSGGAGGSPTKMAATPKRAGGAGDVKTPAAMPAAQPHGSESPTASPASDTSGEMPEPRTLAPTFGAANLNVLSPVKENIGPSERFMTSQEADELLRDAGFSQHE